MMTRVDNRGELEKLVGTWAGPWRVVSTAGSQNVISAADIDTGDRKEVHVAWMSPCPRSADKPLAVTVELSEVFTTL